MSTTQHTADSTEQLLQIAACAGIDYLRTITGRHVAPTPEAITNLSDFHEALPMKGHHAIETLNLLDRVGSPATTATTGGRFFGLVVGGALPVTVLPTGSPPPGTRSSSINRPHRSASSLRKSQVAGSSNSWGCQ